jgi:hypothetical protein
MSVHLLGDEDAVNDVDNGVAGLDVWRNDGGWGCLRALDGHTAASKAHLRRYENQSMPGKGLTTRKE